MVCGKCLKLRDKNVWKKLFPETAPVYSIDNQEKHKPASASGRLYRDCRRRGTPRGNLSGS